MHYVSGSFLKIPHRKGQRISSVLLYNRMTYRAGLQAEKGVTTGYNSYKDRSFFREASDIHYGKEKNYDFIYGVSVDINYFIRNSIQDYRSHFKSLRVAADPVADRPHFDGSGSDLLLYDPSDTGGNWNYQDGGQGDPAGIKMKRLNACLQGQV